MKKIIGIALMIAGSSAFASKARYNALGQAAHLTDTQTVFNIPSDMMSLPELMEFNFGSNAIGQNTDGGMIRSAGDARIGFFLGAVDSARTGDYLGIENPFSVVYGAKAGDMTWGVLFSYASSKVKKDDSSAFDDKSQDFMKLTGSVVMGDTTVALDLGLANKAKGNADATPASGDQDHEFSKTPMELSVYHKMGEWTVYGDYKNEVEKDNAGGSEVKTTTSTMKLGGVHAMKSEGADFFYGLEYTMIDAKAGSTKSQASMFPVILGIETDAASWLTLRGSVKQNVLLGTTKVTGASGPDTIIHDTTINAGMGFKFTKSTLDITLTSASTGAINGSSFGANAGMTYLF